MRFLIFYCVFFCLSLQQVNGHIYDTSIVKKDRKTEESIWKLKAFTSVSISGSFDVELIYGHKNEVIVEGDKKQIDNTSVVLRGKELVIKHKKESHSNKLIKLSIYCGSLREIYAAGKAELRAPETMEGRLLNITIAEHASCYMDLKYENIKCELSGAAQVDFSGHCKQLTIETADAVYLECQELKAERLTIKAKGASSTKLYATQYLKVAASNAANIVYWGKPKQKDFKTEGSVRLEANP